MLHEDTFGALERKAEALRVSVQHAEDGGGDTVRKVGVREKKGERERERERKKERSGRKERGKFGGVREEERERKDDERG